RPWPDRDRIAGGVHGALARSFEPGAWSDRPLPGQEGRSPRPRGQVQRQREAGERYGQAGHRAAGPPGTFRPERTHRPGGSAGGPKGPAGPKGDKGDKGDPGGRGPAGLGGGLKIVDADGDDVGLVLRVSSGNYTYNEGANSGAQFVTNLNAGGSGDEWFLFSAGTTGLNVCGDGYYESCYLGGGAYQLFAGSGCTGQPYSYIYSDYGTPATD